MPDKDIYWVAQKAQFKPYDRDWNTQMSTLVFSFRIIRWGIFPLLFLLSTTLLADNNTISATNGWVRATPPGSRNAVAFLTLNNHGATDKILQSIQCDTQIAARCEIHEHINKEGKMRMQRVTDLSVPRMGTRQFAPGGYHIMLLELTEPLIAGTTVEFTFIFTDQTQYHFNFPVKPVAQE